MEQLGLGIGIGMIFSLVMFVGLLLAKAGGIGNAFWGLDVAGRAHSQPELRGKVQSLLEGSTAPATTVTSPPPPPPVKKVSGESLKLLRVLQSEARLVDFFMEDLSAAPPDVIKDGVMKVQKDALAALNKYMSIVPVMAQREGDSVSVPKGYDPSAIAVTGNVTGTPPFQGELLHPGWKATNLKLPSEADGQDPLVIQPAEVQLG